MRPPSTVALLEMKEENDRLAALYESVVSRTALIEKKITKVVLCEERIRHNGEPIQEMLRPNGAEKPFPKLAAKPSSYLPLQLIDVGAQPLVSEDHVYATLKRAGACLITGFEALPDKDPPSESNTRMLNIIVGAGGPAIFHVAQFDPTSSLMEANFPFLRQFMALADMCKAVSEYPVETTRLDDISDIPDCDFLKLDIQGGELDVLRGANRLLERTVVVHTEVEFSQVYRDQPLFADIDTHLRGKGSELIDLIKFGHNTYAELPSRRTASRLLWSDAIYFRNVETLSNLGAQKLMRAAYIAHVNYGMWDLAAHILARYDAKYGSKSRSRVCCRHRADLTPVHGAPDRQASPEYSRFSTARPIGSGARICRS